MIIPSVHEELKAWHAEYTIFWNSKYYDFKVNDVEDALGKEISSPGKLATELNLICYLLRLYIILCDHVKYFRLS